MKQVLTASGLALALAGCSPAIESSPESSDTTVSDVAETTPTEDTRTAGYSETRNAYFGDLHIHTRNSFDAYIFNVRQSSCRTQMGVKSFPLWRTDKRRQPCAGH